MLAAQRRQGPGSGRSDGTEGGGGGCFLRLSLRSPADAVHCSAAAHQRSVERLRRSLNAPAAARRADPAQHPMRLAYAALLGGLEVRSGSEALVCPTPWVLCSSRL
eukprot:COSAG01_NODE_17_length_39991_cov_30.596160_22_plen_106_part_00